MAGRKHGKRKHGKIRAILARPDVRRLLPDEHGGYTAYIHEFPGCVAEGETAELAQLQGCSVNQLLAVAISEYVGRQGLPQVNGYLASK